MPKTIKKVAKCILNVATHPSFTSGALPAGSYNFNVAEFLPKGALVTQLKGNLTTALADGTNLTLKVGSGTGQALTSTISSWTGVTSPALTDTDGIVITSGGNLGFTSVGDYTAGVLEVFVEYIY